MPTSWHLQERENYMQTKIYCPIIRKRKTNCRLIPTGVQLHRDSRYPSEKPEDSKGAPLPHKGKTQIEELQRNN